MPPKPRWLLAIPDAIRQLEALDRELLTRRDREQLFGVSKARAAILMRTFGAERTGNVRTLVRTSLLRRVRARRKGAVFSLKLAGLPAGVTVVAGRTTWRTPSVS